MKSAIYFVFLITKQVFAQTQKVTVIEKNCNVPTKYGCSKKVFRCDTNISLIYYGNHRITVSEENLNNLHANLKIYGVNLSSDRIYFEHILDK